MKKIIYLCLCTVITAILVCGCSASVDDAQPPEQQTVTPQQTENNDFIGQERAKEIALERAGITPDDVIFDRVELDRDNGVWQYEVDFRKGLTEYEAEIKADDGTILKWETDAVD